jgi:phosphoglycerate dehydrogenase-like enzyme
MDARGKVTPRRGHIISGPRLSPAHVSAIALAGGTVLLDGANEDRAAAAAAIAGADVWFGAGLDATMLRAGTALQWYQTATVGLESVLFEELVDSDVLVSNVRYQHNAVSEHALALMLSVSRDLPSLFRAQQLHRWSTRTSGDFVALEGRRLLVLGTGTVGASLASRARSFGMTVDGLSRTGRNDLPWDTVFTVDRLDEAVGRADWIVDALPLTDATRGLVSDSMWEATRRGVVFVNVGRGGTVDHESLLRHLRSGHIRAAALDVMEEEPLPADSELWDLPNVLITPHVAGISAHSAGVDNAVACLVDNLPSYLSWAPLRSQVDTRLGY